jgi:hypothetical protein
MGAFVSDDDVVRYTAEAQLLCGQFVIVPDGRVGIVQNMKPVAVGETATVRVRGVVEVPAAEAISAGQDVGIHVANQTVLKAGATGTTLAGKCLYDVADTKLAQVDLGVFSGKVTSVGASTAAAGSTTADSGVLPANTANVYLTSGADGTKGVRIHADDKIQGRKIYVANGVSNAILKVYPPSGGTINGAAADAAVSSVSGKGVMLICVNASANTWAAF